MKNQEIRSDASMDLYDLVNVMSLKSLRLQRDDTEWMLLEVINAGYK